MNARPRFAVLTAPALVAAVAAASFATGCSSHNDATPADAGTATVDLDGEVTCTNDPLAEQFVANLSKPGKTSAMTFTLASGDPAPPSMGLNTWKVKLAHAGGAAIADATITATACMPRHGHCAFVTPTVTSANDGTYTITDLDFFMPGLWQITLDAKAEGATDEGVFSFCVEG